MVKKLRKDFTFSLHVTAIEDKYIRIRKRQTGMSFSDIICEAGLSRAAELFFLHRKKNSRNEQAVASASPVQ